MRFLVDAQLPPGLVGWLCEQGHPTQHVFDLNLADAGDTAIWAKANELGAVLITKDEDFVLIREHAGAGSAVVWLRVGNAVNRVLIGRFETALPAIPAALDAGESVIEVR